MGVARLLRPSTGFANRSGSCLMMFAFFREPKSIEVHQFFWPKTPGADGTRPQLSGLRKLSGFSRRLTGLDKISRLSRLSRLSCFGKLSRLSRLGKLSRLRRRSRLSRPSNVLSPMFYRTLQRNITAKYHTDAQNIVAQIMLINKGAFGFVSPPVDGGGGGNSYHY